MDASGIFIINTRLAPLKYINISVESGNEVKYIIVCIAVTCKNNGDRNNGGEEGEGGV